MFRFRIKTFFTALFLFTLISFFGFTTEAHALGISPAAISLEDIQNDVPITKYIYISRANPLANETYKLTVRGTGASYVSVPDEVLLPKHEKQVSVPITILPQAAQNTSYQAKINIEPTGSSATQGMIQVLSALSVSVNFNVTDTSISDVELKNMYFTTGDKPGSYVVNYSIQNNGNQPWHLDKINLLLQGSTPGTQSIQLAIPDIAHEIPAKTDRNGSAPFTIAVEPGNYMVKALFEGDAEITLEGERNFTVNVEDLRLYKKVSYKLKKGLTNFSAVILLVSVVLLVVGLVLLSKFFKRR